jgi:CheY-like chemotaxis protein
MNAAVPRRNRRRRAQRLSDDTEDVRGDSPPLERRGDLTPIPGGRPPAFRARTRRRGRVLFVDDNPDAREMYALYFKGAGYDAATAPSGPAAIAKAHALRPDVIVMDLAMPGMSGLSAARRIKGDPRLRKVPIILLTGHGLRAASEDGLVTGIDLFLTKPCLPDDLEGHVRRFLDARPASRDGD